MSLPAGTEPIDDDEILYRRIPVSQEWYDPNDDLPPSPEAFRPVKHDATGLSLSREKYKNIEEAARGQAGKNYFVAVLRAGDLREHGIEVVACPQKEDPGHAGIPALNYEDRKTDQAKEWKTILAHKLTIRVEGPFGQ